MSNIEINDDLIARFLTGDALPEEAMAMMDWLKDSGNRAHFEQLEATWLQAGEVLSPRFGKDEAWKRVSAGVRISSAAAESSGKRVWWPLGIAAAVLTLAVSAYFLLFTHTPVPSPLMGSVITTDNFRFIELPDRSTVTLHRESEVQYPYQFQTNERQVRLMHGKAFFNVTSDASRPFIVEAGELMIRVLGTEFNVEISDSVLSVHVREGRVFLLSRSDSATLTTGMTGRLTHGHFAVTDAPVGNLYSYATQRLVFDDAPLGDVIRDLEDSYPYTFELKNKALQNCRLTANFYKDDIDKIVNLVAETLNLTVSKNGRHFTIEGEGCL